MNASPSSRRRVSKRCSKQNGSLVKRKPSRQAPAAVRSFTRARSASEIPMSALYLLESGKGSDGWLRTGASTTSSTIMARAKPPVKHMPTTPTPGPPQRSCSAAASLRSHTVTGLVLLRANEENSREMQAGPIDRRAYAPVGGRPGSPNRLGSTAVHPAAATRRPNSATRGVMPGISLMTITAGPAPMR